MPTPYSTVQAHNESVRVTRSIMAAAVVTAATPLLEAEILRHTTNSLPISHITVNLDFTTVNNIFPDFTARELTLALKDAYLEWPHCYVRAVDTNCEFLISTGI